MACIRPVKLLAILLVIGASFAGCGGGGADTAQSQPVSPSGPLSVLSWNPPSKYADNALLDPYRDLDHYEVYVRQDSNFTDADLPVAFIAAVASEPGTGSKILEKEFLLENIKPFIGPAVRHYVSLKSVGIDGQKSGFMPPLAWDNI